MRVVPRTPETFALTRVVCLEASISKTCFTGISLARAIARMGSLISGFVSGLYVLKSGSMNTGAMKSKKNEEATTMPVPQIHHVFGARRNTTYSTIKKIVLYVVF